MIGKNVSTLTLFMIFFCMIMASWNLGVSAHNSSPISTSTSSDHEERGLRLRQKSGETSVDTSQYGSSGYSNGLPSSSSSYGSSSSSYGSSSSSSYGSYGSYGSSSKGKTKKKKRTRGKSNNSYGSSSYGSSSSYGGSSYGGSSYGGSSYGGSSYGNSSYRHEEPMIPIAWVILLIMTTVGIGMLITAHQFESNPEGGLPNFCRLSIHIMDCTWKVIYNCYHCRLSEIPSVINATDGENEDDYTDQELQTMKLRPGIERALDAEHTRSLNKLRSEVAKNVKRKIKKQVGTVERGPGLVALFGAKKTYVSVDTEEL